MTEPVRITPEPIPEWVLLECGHYATPGGWPVKHLRCTLPPCRPGGGHYSPSRRIVRIER